VFHVKQLDEKQAARPENSGFSLSERDFLARHLPASLNADLTQIAPLLSHHLDELSLWAPRLNLVGEGTRDEWLRRHFLDSLLAVEPLRERFGNSIGRLMDIGSGAGFPGLPLAAALRPEETVLVEPRRRRAHFLRSVLRRWMRDDVRVENLRLEATAGLMNVDVLVSRATFSDVGDLLEGSLPLLRPGGLVMVLCSASAPKVKLRAGLEHFEDLSPFRYVLPESDREHELRFWRRFPDSA